MLGMLALGSEVAAFFITTRGRGRDFGAIANGATDVEGSLVKLPMVEGNPPGGVKREPCASVDGDWRPRGGVQG